MNRLAMLPVLFSVLSCAGDQAPEPGLENGSFTAELDGRTVHYEVHGTGPVLMTVPNSWGLSLEGLRAMYRPLEAHAILAERPPLHVDR